MGASQHRPYAKVVWQSDDGHMEIHAHETAGVVTVFVTDPAHVATPEALCRALAAHLKIRVEIPGVAYVVQCPSCLSMFDPEFDKPEAES